jgi:hypothetical protein
MSKLHNIKVEKRLLSQILMAHTVNEDMETTTNSWTTPSCGAKAQPKIVVAEDDPVY